MAEPDSLAQASRCALYLHSTRTILLRRATKCRELQSAQIVDKKRGGQCHGVCNACQPCTLCSVLAS